MNTDPIHDANEHYQQIQARADAQQAAEFAASAEFLALCHKGDANACAAFAHPITDWEANSTPHIVNGQHLRPKRNQILNEVLAASLDAGGPTTSELMQLLLNASLGHAQVQTQATALLERMSETWASQHIEIGD